MKKATQATIVKHLEAASDQLLREPTLSLQEEEAWDELIAVRSHIKDIQVEGA